MLWKFHRIYNPERQYADHFREVHYTLSPPPDYNTITLKPADLYVHRPRMAQRRTV
jgi:magnesium-protoporphyrin IX monomethyl ester (oxidative) cyclase